MSFLPQNVGETDRGFRIVGGVFLLLYAVISLSAGAQTLVSIIALAVIFSGMVGYSLLYSITGTSTLPPKPKKKVVRKKKAKKKK